MYGCVLDMSLTIETFSFAAQGFSRGRIPVAVICLKDKILDLAFGDKHTKCGILSLKSLVFYSLIGMN